MGPRKATGREDRAVAEGSRPDGCLVVEVVVLGTKVVVDVVEEPGTVVDVLLGTVVVGSVDVGTVVVGTWSSGPWSS